MTPAKIAPEVFPITPEVRRIGQAIEQAGGRAILVGGWVRDCLMGIPHSKDFDIEVFSLSTRKLQEVLKRFGPVHTVGRHFGVLKLATRQAEYDVSVPRRESKIGKGHKEFEIVADPDMPFEEAAARRDFTINSMGFAFMDGELLDPYGGRRDLDRRLLRHTSAAFGEDPLRVLRAMQFAGRFEMTVAEETIRISVEQDLSELPKERIWEEFKKLLLYAEFPSHGLRYAKPLGILPYFPELEALHDLPPVEGEEFPATPWQRTLETVDRAAAQRIGEEKADLALMAAALIHRLEEIEAPAVGASRAAEASPAGEAAQAAEADGPIRRLLERFTRENAFPDAVAALVRDLLAPERLYAIREHEPDAEIRRLAIRVSIPLLLRLSRARFEASAGERCGGIYDAGEWLVERARALGVLDGPPQPILKGRHLLEMGMRPGPELGVLLKAAFEWQLDGGFGTLEDALRWAEVEHGAAPRR